MGPRPAGRLVNVRTYGRYCSISRTTVNTATQPAGVRLYSGATTCYASASARSGCSSDKYAYVRTLYKAAGRPGPHAALNLAANSSSRALFSRQLSTVIVNVETCSDCGKRILLCIPFLISNHLPYAVSIQSFFHLPTLLLCS